MSISRHTGLNLIFNALALAVYLISVPGYLRVLDQADFGILTLIWLLITYFRLLDFGVSRAVTQRLSAEPPGHSTDQKLVWTALASSAAIGCAAAALFLLSADFTISRWPRAAESAYWLAAIAPLSTVSATLLGALQGRQRFWEMNLAIFVGLVLMQLAPLMVIFRTGGGLEQVIPLVVAARVMTLTLIVYFCYRTGLIDYTPQLSLSTARRLLSFGAWAGISAVVSPILTATDRFMIAFSRGAAAVPLYSVPFSSVERTLIVAHSLSEALYPRFGSMTQANSLNVARQSIKILAIVLTPISVVAMFLFEPLLALWINKEFARQSAFIGQLLLVGFWCSALGSIPQAYLQSRGRPDTVAIIHLAEVIPYITALYLSLYYWDLTGAAVTFGLRMALELALLWKVAGIGLAAARGVVPSAIVLGLSLTLATITSAYTITWLFSLFTATFVAIWIAAQNKAIKEFKSLLAR